MTDEEEKKQKTEQEKIDLRVEGKKKQEARGAKRGLTEFGGSLQEVGYVFGCVCV